MTEHTSAALAFGGIRGVLAEDALLGMLFQPFTSLMTHTSKYDLPQERMSQFTYSSILKMNYSIPAVCYFRDAHTTEIDLSPL